MRPFFVSGPDGSGLVEAWSGYPLQFGGQRRFGWQDDMAATLRRALGGLEIAPGAVLAGLYLSTDKARCDAENRLFTDLGAASFPKDLTALRFEHGPGLPPSPSVPVDRVAGHMYYYRYQLGASWRSWEPARLVARWHRVPRWIGADGSARPVWLAMRQAAAAGRVEFLARAGDESAPFGVRIVIHAGGNGPRQAASVSETVIDGIIASFHAGLAPGPAAEAAAALAPRLPGMTASAIEALTAWSPPLPLSATPALTVRGTYVQISPCDERCKAGEVTIRPDAHGRYPEFSGEIFALRPAGSSTGRQDLWRKTHLARADAVPGAGAAMRAGNGHSPALCTSECSAIAANAAT